MFFIEFRSEVDRVVKELLARHPLGGQSGRTMMRKLLVLLFFVPFALSCSLVSGLTTQTTPTSGPTTASAPAADVEALLAQQIKQDLSAHPRPACQAGTHNEKEWADYGLALAPALVRLFSDSRGQALSPQALAVVFKRGSGLPLQAFESNSEAVLVTIVQANCNNPTGGGDSPAAPRDAMYVVNRHGGIWQVAQIANLVNGVWAVDHWTALVTRTEYGGGASFEVWHVGQAAGGWKYETMLQFTQLASAPLPHMSADGSAITLFSQPAACDLPKNTPPNSVIESEYKWQNGQYQCSASRVLPAATPTPHP